jgi:hypothetical protein
MHKVKSKKLIIYEIKRSIYVNDEKVDVYILNLETKIVKIS